MGQCGAKHPTAVRVGTDDEPEPVRCSRRATHTGSHETFYGEHLLRWVDDVDDGPEIIRSKYAALDHTEPDATAEPERRLRAVPEVGEWCPGSGKPNEAIKLDHVECGHCEYKIIGMRVAEVPEHHVVGITFTPPRDPECERFVDMTVRVRTFGRERHEQNIVRSVAAALHNTFGDRFTIYRDGKAVHYDPVIEDGNEPPGYKSPFQLPPDYADDIEP